MKIAIVLNTSWNIYNFRMGLIRSFLSKGYEVYAIAPRDKYSALLENEGCKYVEVEMDSRGANPMKDLGLIVELYGIYKKIAPDVVLHFTIKPNIYGTIAAKMLKIPAINNVCGLGTIFLNNNVTSRIAILMYKIAFKFPKNIFFQNEEDLNLFVEKKLASPAICRLIPGSGIDLEKFRPASKKQGKKFTFLMVARLIHDKGVVEYVEAVKRLKAKGMNADFKIIGAKDPLHKRGIPLNLLEEWTNKKIIDYLGVAEDIRLPMEDADCVVLPSYREGAPRTLLEAASLAKPIVATDVPASSGRP